jgi:hypothetical protein
VLVGVGRDDGKGAAELSLGEKEGNDAGLADFSNYRVTLVLVSTKPVD